MKGAGTVRLTTWVGAGWGDAGDPRESFPREYQIGDFSGLEIFTRARRTDLRVG